MQKTKFLWWKFVAVWICFLLLHFSYGTFLGLFFRIIDKVNEAVFIHMKMLFVAYSLVSLVEFVLRRTRIKSVGNFFPSRALIAVVFPWLTIIFWFLASALKIQLPLLWELIFANVMNALSIYLALRIEELIDDVEFRPSLKWLILILFVIAVFV